MSSKENKNPNNPKKPSKQLESERPRPSEKSWAAEIPPKPPTTKKNSDK